jgi:hypothetical protein
MAGGYWLGDASQTRWTQEIAEGVAAHMGKHAAGSFTAKPIPSASKELDPARLRRGLVISKGVAHDCVDSSDTYFLEVVCDDDPGCSETIVVCKELHDTVCIAGLGQDWFLLYREGDEPCAEREAYTP